jgi:hypothetical protein
MATSKKNNLRTPLIIIGAVILVFLAVIILKSPTTQNPIAGDSLAPSAILNDLSSVTKSIFDSVGQGSVTNLPIPINGPNLTQDGKPRIVYIGAEYCPYCAAERWSMVIALDRFGSFTGLKTTHSSSSDVFPSTQTFSFHGANYTSNYVAFTPVEIYSNVPVASGGYTPLDKTTTEEQDLMNTYDAPPYVASSNQGAIPFIYFAGKYLITGASYSPQVLQGKTYSQIAAGLLNPKSDIAQGVIGGANTITAAICGTTNNQPGSVCTSQIQAIEAKMHK